MSTLSWKRRLGRWMGPLTKGTDRRVILLYHSIGPNAPAVSVARFRDQVAWLAAHAQLEPIESLLRSDSNHGIRVALTFDDGYGSLRDAAAPVLAEHGATATVYLNTGRIGDRTRLPSDAALGHYPGEQFLTWSDVHALSAAGWTIGSHGVEHLDLTATPPQRVEEELRASRHEIEQRLGLPCRHFAYTWGRFTAPLQQWVQVAGYRSAVSGLHGPLTARSPTYALPRIDVRSEYELPDFVDVVTGAWDYLGFKQRLARTLR